MQTDKKSDKHKYFLQFLLPNREGWSEKKNKSCSEDATELKIIILFSVLMGRILNKFQYDNLKKKNDKNLLTNCLNCYNNFKKFFGRDNCGIMRAICLKSGAS